MRYDTDHKGITRRKILSAAAAGIRTDGIDRVSVARLMADAGLTHGGFYLHFASKDQLIENAIDFMFEERYARTLTRLSHPDPAKTLRDFIAYYLSERHCASIADGCPVPALAPSVKHMSPAARLRFRSGVTRLTMSLTVLLAEAGIADAADEAQSLLAELSGAVSLARSMNDGEMARAILAASHQSLKRRFGASLQAAEPRQ